MASLTFPFEPLLDNSLMVGNPSLTGLWKGCPSLKRKHDEGCYRCTMPGFAEMSIASMCNRSRQPDWSGLEQER